MKITPEVSAVSVGLIVGYLTMYFLRRFKTFNVKVFAGVLTTIFSGGAVTFLFKQGKQLLWYYPPGVVMGLMLYAFVAIVLALITGGNDDGGGGGGGGGSGGRRARRKGRLAGAAHELARIFTAEVAELPGEGERIRQPAKI